ncbi:DUF6368 family protein, partial [Streptomyces sp. NPDC051576]|uniref:DUF6368 family protein n=1 Tax=Streptomyces sp. NPDC051576 TaxID=3155803 RepID=UPI00341AE11D
MSGPVLVIELAEAVPHSAIQRLREFLVYSSARFERALSPFLVAASSGLGEEALASEASEASAGDV